MQVRLPPLQANYTPPCCARGQKLQRAQQIALWTACAPPRAGKAYIRKTKVPED